MKLRLGTFTSAAASRMAVFVATVFLIAGTARAQPIPELAEWEAQMVEWGRRHTATLQDPNVEYDPKLDATYYDAQRVYLQIWRYTGDPSWLDSARAARAVYRDKYVIPNNGRASGYRNFTGGLAMDYLLFGDTESRRAVVLLANNAAFASDTTPLAWTESSELSREVAYAIMAYLDAEKVGEPRRQRLGPLVNQALGHLDQWFGSKTAPYVRPFMVALTAEALLKYHQANPDPRVLPALIQAADAMWNTLWLAQDQSFMYTDRETSTGGREAAPDLNLLIAPLYSQLYRATGQLRFRDRADAIFAGGVGQAYLRNPKQYNQNYRWSFQYVQDRSNSAPATGGVTPAYGSSGAGVARTLSATYSDPDGAENIGNVYIQIGTGGDVALWGLYNSTLNRLYLLSDDHSAWLGGFAPGSPNVIRTGEGSLDCAATSVSRAENTVTVSWSLAPPAHWAGTTRSIYLYVEDRAGLYDGWDRAGGWTITAP